jgi:N6-adenosine-specific RNA methylase IME4
MHNQWKDQNARPMGGLLGLEAGHDPGAVGQGLAGARRFHFAEGLGDQLQAAGPFGSILADPPWRFQNSTGKVAPEHRRLRRYATMSAEEIAALAVADIAADPAHLYLWCPNAMLWEGMHVMRAWGFQYKTVIVWHKVRKDGGSDGRGVGFYFRNVTEMLLFGARGKNARTLPPGRRQVNYIASRKREHSRKPDEQYGLIEACSPGPWLELFARGRRANWISWGDEAR